MTAQEILNSEDFKRCQAFHGHVCPGLSIGFRAARTAMAWLKAHRAEDEEMVAVVETDACSADAVQVLTGCTFGKGNFLFKDHGKMALTLFSRKTGEGVRVVARPGATAPDGEHMALIQKMIRGEATAEEKERFEALHMARTHMVLEAPEETLFTLTPVHTQIPPRARIEPSGICDRCGEAAMASRLQVVDNEKLCRGCVPKSPETNDAASF